jgi:hypothetical protein
VIHDVLHGLIHRGGVVPGVRAVFVVLGHQMRPAVQLLDVGAVVWMGV